MAKRKRRGRAQDKRRESSSPSYMRFVVGGISLLLILAVGFAVVLAVNSSGSGSNFEFEVYQGADVLGGDNLSLDDVLALNKPLVLNFWAGDCPPCRAEMPAFQRIYEEHQDHVVFLGLDVGVFTGLGTKSSALRLLDELGITYPIGAPPNRSAVVSYAVRSMPTTVFFDSNGKVVDRVDGGISEFRMATIVDSIHESS